MRTVANGLLRTAVVLLSVAAILAGCAMSAPPGAPHAAAAPTPVPGANAAAAPRPSVGPRYRIVYVETTLRVRAVPDALASLRQTVDRFDGYVQSASTDLEFERRASVVARVPAARLGAFRRELQGLGSCERDEERSTDVTEQHADLDARLRNARAEEERLLALLDGRAAALADVLAVEQQVARVREQVEQLDAQRQALDAQIAYSQVEVSLVEDPGLGTRWPGGRIGLAARAGLGTAWDAVLLAVVVGLRAGPALALLAFVAGVVLFLRRRVQSRTARSKGPASSNQ